jgi:hypothetical protein
MHLIFLIEDQSGEVFIKNILSKIIGPESDKYSKEIHSYKGCGKIPENIHKHPNPSHRFILEQLPKLLNGFARSYENIDYTIIVLIDNDNRNCQEFKQELLSIQTKCRNKPNVFFRIAIEEFEAWHFGDKNAIKKAYPKAKDNVLNSYIQDSICNTWEKLADAIFPGGSVELKKKPWYEIGKIKYEWAQNITPFIDIENNQSSSFKCFLNKLRELMV